MKIPTIFITKEQGLEKKFYIKSKKSKNLDKLLRSCENFLEKQKNIESRDQKYGIGYEIAQEEKLFYTKLCYTKKDLQNLVEEINVDEENDSYLGIYVSVLLNKLIQEKDVIVFKPKSRLTGLGTGLERGKVIIKGDVADCTGVYLRGGKLIVEGNAGNCTGYCMTSGEIEIRNGAGGWTGMGLCGGRITVFGSVKGFTGSHMGAGEIIIYGDDEECTGEFMGGGSILVKGSTTKYFLGQFMTGGIINVDLDAGRLTGSCMDGGLIIVGRDVGPLVGAHSKGGEIRIGGKIETIGQWCKAKVYQKDVLIWPTK